MAQTYKDIISGLGTITQGYGATDFAKSSGFYSGNSHPSVDYVPKGNENVSVLNSGGIVEYARESGGWGGQVKIKGDDGKYYYYSHLREFNVKPGQRVKQGDILGLMGGGANDPMKGASTGRHIDFGIEDETGKRTNPLEFEITNAIQNLQPQTQIPKTTKSNLWNTLKTRMAKPEFKMKVVNLLKNRRQNIQTKPQTSNFSTTQGTTDSFSKIKSAIAEQESGNNYKKVGPIIPNRSDRALGKYQIMGANLPQWSKTHLGRVVSQDEFLANPDIQEKIAEGQMKSYYNSAQSLGLKGDDIARYVSTSWYAGQGTANSKVKNGKFIYDSSDTRGQAIVNGVAPSISGYGNQVLSRIK